MGREFASAVARWCHLLDLDFVPRITAICGRTTSKFDWFTANFATIRLATTDYHDLLDSDVVDAVYCAVPHNQHADLYTDIIAAGIPLLGEKPFGIDAAANQRILAALEQHPEVFAACVSQFTFYPGAQRVLQAIQSGALGKIIEVEAGFLHSSDLDPGKPINWKRIVATNGEYGCMGDLGMHVLHIPLRVGWAPRTVHARLSKITTERPDGAGRIVPCETWDNAILDCTVEDGGDSFPMTLKFYRIAPGEMNTWSLRVLGTEGGIAFSTKTPRTLYRMVYTRGQEQAWQQIDLGYRSAYPTITGPIFEFGMPDALLQMIAAFGDELVHGRAGMTQPFYCVTPEETRQQHILLSGALRSQRERSVVTLDYSGQTRAGSGG